MVPVSWHVHVRWHNWGLHPLIHTSPLKTLAQDGGEGQNGAECALKYVIRTPAGYVKSDERLAFFGQLGQLLSGLVRLDKGAQPLEDLQGLR